MSPGNNSIQTPLTPCFLLTYRPDQLSGIGSILIYKYMFKPPLIFGTSEFDLSQNFPTLPSGSIHNFFCLSWIILVSHIFCCLLLFFSLPTRKLHIDYITISFCKAVQSSQLCVIPFRFSNWQERARLFTTMSAQMEIWFCPDGNMIFSDGNMIWLR